MAKLRLKQPSAPGPHLGSGDDEVVDVAVSVPVPHLEGIYSYRSERHGLQVGSVVSVPFGSSDTYGFVVAIREQSPTDRTFKKITRVLRREPVFTESALNRYRIISDLHGSSLFSIISSAIPTWSSRSAKFADGKVEVSYKPSSKDGQYLARLFGAGWKKSRNVNLLIPIGVTWERVAVSLFLENPIPTLILVPTDRMLSLLTDAMRNRGVEDFLSLSSHMKKSERTFVHQELMRRPPQILVGTRGAALAPFGYERVITVDPGDPNYIELRSPYYRADDPELWMDAGERITISHSRDLRTLARDEDYIVGSSGGRFIFYPASVDTLVTEIGKIIRNRGTSLSILVSVNDKSYGSGLICAGCRNRARCDCGFPLIIPRRGAIARCTQCFKDHENFICSFCGGSKLSATKGGSESLALTLAKSIRDSVIHLSNVSTPKTEILRSGKTDIVISTHGMEPRIFNPDGSYYGFDVIVLIGGRAAFTGSSLNRSDRFRSEWGRLLGLANVKQCVFIVDLEKDHPEFLELQRIEGRAGLQLVLQERRELSLPPFSVLVELSGSDSVLQGLRSSLKNDQIFMRNRNEIFPVHNGKMIARVDSQDRWEMLQLLQSMTRLRSAKRLPVVSYRVDPQE